MPRRVRLELLNDALDRVFEEIPSNVEIFDQGVSRGDAPRLWIDVITYDHGARIKRNLSLRADDTRYGRKILVESTDIPQTVKAISALHRRPSDRA